MTIKLIFFDMEGTLFRKAVHDVRGNVAPSAWGMLAQQLGPEGAREESASVDKWNAGRYSGYVEWMEDTIRIHQKYGVTRQLFDSVMAGIDYHPGVDEVFQQLRARGIRTALVSGGFKAQADRRRLRFCRRWTQRYSFCQSRRCQYRVQRGRGAAGDLVSFHQSKAG